MAQNLGHFDRLFLGRVDLKIELKSTFCVNLQLVYANPNSTSEELTNNDAKTFINKLMQLES